MSDEEYSHSIPQIQESKISAIDEQLREYIVEWRKQKAKEEEELKKLKEKQAKRKVQREEENRLMAEKKKLEEERKAREAEEQKQRDAEERRKKFEEAEKKRQAMMEAMKGTLTAAQMELSKTKEQIEEEKQAALKVRTVPFKFSKCRKIRVDCIEKFTPDYQVRIKPLNIDNLDAAKLKEKAIEMWNCIIKLETEKYDLEEKRKRQDYDPKIQVASKYERRVDTRTYDDKKKLFNGGFDEQTKESNEADWKKKVEQYTNSHHTRLPKWFGERPGKKKGEPESPEDEVKQDEEDDEDIGQPPQFNHEEEEVEEEEEEEKEEEEGEEEDDDDDDDDDDEEEEEEEG
ncbi:unnamed protein product [Nesidiocoris tenuis]|uniref:Troponin T n=1 Tax=Nesidiocoris tenuis TaxID=355587 RepID=A0A6H5G1G4_9HEMI|nr:unnamed protein product [Nesidiocoris tenuis]